MLAFTSVVLFVHIGRGITAVNRGEDFSPLWNWVAIGIALAGNYLIASKVCGYDLKKKFSCLLK